MRQSELDISQGSIMLKGGKSTRMLSKKMQKLLIAGKIHNATIKAVIEYTSEKESLRIARAYKRLAIDPSVKLDITFKKITDEPKNQ